MSVYNLEYNKDDSVIRLICVAVLHELNEKLNYYQLEDGVRQKKDVPFFYSLSGTERYLTDIFLKEDSDKAQGTYEPVPRGVIRMSSMSIDSGALVNKFIRSEILEKMDGKLLPFSYETMIVPINISFDATIICNSYLELFKITESIIKNLYKNNPFTIDMDGQYNLKGVLGLPEDFDHEKLFQFSSTDNKLNSNNKINFTLEVKSFYPVFTDDSKIFAGNIIESFEHTVSNQSIAPKEDIHTNSSLVDPKMDGNNLQYIKNIVEPE